jgi:DNA-binding NtrC family response regulator
MPTNEFHEEESGEATQPTKGIGTHQGRLRVLLIEDDQEMRGLLAEVLREEGWEPVEAANGAEGLLSLHRECFNAVIMDQRMPGLNGLELLPGIRTICPRTPVIFITAFGDAAMREEAMTNGAFDFLFKPFRMEDLIEVLRRALARREFPAGAFAADG